MRISDWTSDVGSSDLSEARRRAPSSGRPAMTSTRLVALGGGHGLSVTLRACAPWAELVTAIGSTADDGGSTGRLRAPWAVPGVGDLRRCRCRFEKRLVGKEGVATCGARVSRLILQT